jgi:hypothetical protein
VWMSVLALGWLCMPLAAQSASPPPGANARVGNVDYAQVRPSVQKMETGILEGINSAFNNPLSLRAAPKGFYLQGYGYVFSFLVNIRWGMTHTPFGDIPDKDNSPQQRKQRIEDCKDALVRVLFYLGGGMAQLEKDKSITIAAQFEETNPDVGTVNTTVILSVLKSDLDELGNKQDKFNEFRQKVKIVGY